MKQLILIASMLFSISVMADSTFLSGLNFYRVYENSGNEKFTQIKEKGISVDKFIKQLNGTEETTTLGEKIALIEALSSYYEWGENTKGKFENYQKAYFNYLIKNNYTNMSFDNKEIDPELRLIWMLMMNDYDTTLPNVEAYQSLAKEMPNSLVAQTISVFSYAYDILYNNRNDFATIQDFKDKYLNPYYQNFDNFEVDVPIEIKESCIEDILPYTMNCEGRLKCLVNTETEQSTIGGLDELFETNKNDIATGTPISELYSTNWVDTKDIALEWIKIQEENIEKINATEVQKAEIRYFFSSKLYGLIQNIDNLTYRLDETSFMAELKKIKSNCNTDAACVASNYVNKMSTDLEKIGITKKDIKSLTSAKDAYKTAFENIENDYAIDGVAAVAGASVEDMETQPNYVFDNSFDALHFLMIYFYIHPEKITEMFDMD